MNRTHYQDLSDQFRRIFDRYAVQLSSAGRDNVEHFLDVAELEMSCESFVFSLIEDKVELFDKDKEELMVLSKCLRLDKESHFCEDFWLVASSFLDAPPG